MAASTSGLMPSVLSIAVLPCMPTHFEMIAHAPHAVFCDICHSLLQHATDEEFSSEIICTNFFPKIIADKKYHLLAAAAAWPTMRLEPMAWARLLAE
jgi:hypothetical protein